MFLGGDDDELEFSSATGGSKLASLFDMDRAASKGGNESLMYTAPKEPKKKPDAAGPPSASATPLVLCAGVAFAYKFTGKEYTNEGKLGVAVIGNHANYDYKFLLYIKKEKPVAFARVTSSFVFTVQPKNYVNFYDDTQQSWSLMFESEATLQQFAKQVALAKFCSVPAKPDLLVIQDLNLGEGPSLENGDNIEIKYSGWVMENNSIGAAIDNGQVLRFRIGKQKVIRALDEGVLGMKKNSRRLLISSPSLITGGEAKAGKFPSGSVLIFEVEILRLKFARERADDAAAAPASVPDVTNEEKDDEKDGIRAKSKLISEQMGQQPAKSDKAKLISRMAKMGQPMLPIVVPQQTDNIEADSPSPSPVSKPGVPTKPVQQSTGVLHGTSALPTAVPMMMPESTYMAPTVTPMGHMMAQPPMHQVPQAMATGAAGAQLSVYQPAVPLSYQAMMGGYQQQPFGGMYPSQVYPMPPQAPPQAPPSTTDTNIPMMLMETRNQNTEVRVSLSRVSDKIDRISEKLDQLNSVHSNALTVASSMPSMEVGMLVHNIERIVMENDRLKKDIMEKSSRVEEQNGKIAELLHRNQLYVEQSNTFLEQRSDSYKMTASQSQARVQSLEQEKVHLAMELSSTTSQLSSCQLEIVNLKKKDSELKQQVDRLLTSEIQGRDDVGSMKLRLSEQDLKLEQLGSQLKEEQQSRRVLNTQLEDLREKLNDVTMERDNLERNLNDKKRKNTEEVSKLEEELKELQIKYETELSELKSRLKTVRSSTESTTAQKMSQIEEDLNLEWKEKCDRLLLNMQEKHQKELGEVVSEKTWLQEKAESLEAKVTELKGTRIAHDEEKDALQEELRQFRIWKDRYDSLRSQATSMKDRYEQRIAELEMERNAVEEEREKAELERNKTQDKARRLQLQLSSLPPGGNTSAENPKDLVVAEVKKIMNTVFRRLRQEFTPDGTYSGATIHNILLENIKTITLEMMQDKDAADTRSTTEVTMQKNPSVGHDEKPSAPTSLLHSEPPVQSKTLPEDNFTASEGQTATESADDEEKPELPAEKDNSAPPTATSHQDIEREEQNDDSSNTAQTNSFQAAMTVEEPDAEIKASDDVDADNFEVIENNKANELQKTDEETNKLFFENVSDSKPAIDSDDDSFTSLTGSSYSNSGKAAEENVVTEHEEIRVHLDGDTGHSENIPTQIEDTTVLEVPGLTKESGDSELRVNSQGMESDHDGMMDKLDITIQEESKPQEAALEPSQNSASATKADDFQTTSSDIPENAKVAVPVESKAASSDIPLFGDDFEDAKSTTQNRKIPPKSSSLFAEFDDEDEGLFSASSKVVVSSTNNTKASSSRPSSGTTRQKTPADTNTSSSKSKGNESDDELASKPPPLPIFGDSDDEKDLDWLN